MTASESILSIGGSIGFRDFLIYHRISELTFDDHIVQNLCQFTIFAFDLKGKYILVSNEKFL